ncbi:hypothetical protein B484DRAFT_224466 [Ochromonadaceae sp. CCMP2298]|nr:hypothetical protein B484DRAFT_224466 [Ochromonadaceae sp. CCMP2298]|mmetsp:Transcript_8994/g.19621  ORF Transcript_8994/g.19621 Transcript_8994/m.19621 type:complete len:160 (-) Transcript_8994:23-502(-)
MLSSQLSRCLGRVPTIALGRAPRFTRALSTPDTKTFAQYMMYKDDAALSMKPLLPTFGPSGISARKVTKMGSMYFEFAVSHEPRVYDWSRKGAFQLTVSECGEVMCLKKGETESAAFYRSDADKTKQMHWEPTINGQGTRTVHSTQLLAPSTQHVAHST